MANGASGYVLTQDAETTSEIHLSIALVGFFLHLIGLFLLLKSTKQKLESELVQERGRKLLWLRQQWLTAALFVLGLQSVNLLTGTLAQAGSMPLVHTAVGIAAISFWGRAMIYLYTFLRV